MLRTLHPWSSRVQEGLELHAVEVPPAPLFRVVVDRQLRPAVRAGPLHTLRMHCMHVDALLRHIQSDALDRPRCLEAQQSSVQLGVLHPAEATPNPFPRGPTPKPDEPIKLI